MEDPSTEPVRLRVLVVDDNEDAAVTTAIVLETMGHLTRTVHDGHSALEAATSWRPDVVLLDLGLPGLTGYQVAESIRAQAWGAAMLLWALSGWGQASDREKSAAAGFDRHLVKPIDPVVLEQLLGEARDARRLS